jgi:hypothetical protein
VETLVPRPSGAPAAVDVSQLVQRELLALAKLHDDAAARQASVVPYWAPCPAEVSGHRAAATLLRQDASRLERLGRLGRLGRGRPTPGTYTGEDERTGCP